MNKKVMMMPSPPSSGSIGTVLKSLGIAKKLRNQKCNVSFVMGGELKKLIHDNGFKVYDCPIPTHQKSIKSITSFAEFMQWAGMGEDAFIKAMVKSELDAINDFKPNVVFAETRPSASISTKISKVPSVMIANWPCHPHFKNNKECKEDVRTYNRLLKYYNQPLIDSATELVYLRADVKLAPTIPELEPELKNVKNIKFTGYILDEVYSKRELPVWFNETKKNKRVFIYLSVSAIPPQIYVDVIKEAFSNSNIEVICGIGYHYDVKKIPKSIDNIKFERYIPAQAVMKSSDLVIFHGGQDTMLMSLLYGVPSIVIPGQHFEREYNAINLAKQGVCKNIQIYAFRPNRLRTLSTEVMTGNYKEHANKLSERVKFFGGTDSCVDTIINMI